jgi:hypothetical protein
MLIFETLLYYFISNLTMCGSKIQAPGCLPIVLYFLYRCINF